MSTLPLMWVSLRCGPDYLVTLKHLDAQNRDPLFSSVHLPPSLLPLPPAETPLLLAYSGSLLCLQPSLSACTLLLCFLSPGICSSHLLLGALIQWDAIIPIICYQFSVPAPHLSKFSVAQREAGNCNTQSSLGCMVPSWKCQ